MVRSASGSASRQARAGAGPVIQPTPTLPPPEPVRAAVTTDPGASASDGGSRAAAI
jgi:hypothetical protein